jgi:hypothetical protein
MSHVAGVWAPGELRLFVNGKRVAAQKASPQLVPGALKLVPRLGLRFAGTMREVRISKSARYDANFTPATRFERDADTLALYHCDEDFGEVLMDSSGNNRHGKIIGAKWVKTAGPAK